jgi:hypothetical protein
MKLNESPAITANFSGSTKANCCCGWLNQFIQSLPKHFLPILFVLSVGWPTFHAWSFEFSVVWGAFSASSRALSVLRWMDSILCRVICWELHQFTTDQTVQSSQFVHTKRNHSISSNQRTPLNQVNQFTWNQIVEQVTPLHIRWNRWTSSRQVKTLNQFDEFTSDETVESDEQTHIRWNSGRHKVDRFTTLMVRLIVWWISTEDWDVEIQDVK